MSRTRSALVVLASGAATLAVVGVGAGATFTDSTHSTQKIQAGTLNMRVTSADGSTSGDGKTVTFPDAAPVNSTFKTAAHTVVIHNAGDITAQEVFLGASHTTPGGANDNALLNQMYVCVYSPSSPNGGPGGVVFNGPLTSLESSGQQVAGSVSPTETDQYTAEFYAGDVTTSCGASNAPSLDNAAQGGIVSPMITLSYQG
jgi:predicted ribosomally synthesized peptide with SipW-like signal peptide